MSEAVGIVGTVVLNVADMDRQKAFWTAFLGVGVARDIDGVFCWLEPQHEGGVSVALQLAGDLGDSAGRVHIDTGVADIGTARAAIEGLGGSHVEDHEVMGFRWTIMADPEGNRFCIAAHPD